MIKILLATLFISSICFAESEKKSTLEKVVETTVEATEKVYESGKKMVTGDSKDDKKTKKISKSEAEQNQKSVDPKVEKKSTMDKVIDTTVEAGEKVYDVGKKAVKSTNKSLGQSRLNRENKNHSLMGDYTIMDTWIPSKLGLQYSYIESPSTSWELSYDQGSIGYGFLFVDITKINDSRLLLMRTSYSQRNSFYISYGLNYYKFSAVVGDKLVSSANSSVPSFDLLEIETLGGSFGIGNRWQFKNWVFGVNWVSIHIPVATLKSNTSYLDYTTSESDRDTVRRVVDVVKRFPTFTALRVQFGYSF